MTEVQLDLLAAHYSELDTEHLLAQRARGNDLSVAAQQAIERVLRERGVTPPPVPGVPIATSELARPSSEDSTSRRLFGTLAKGMILVAALLVWGFSKAFAHSVPGQVVGLLLLALLGGHSLYKKLARPTETDDQRRQREQRDKVGEGGFTELMLAAGEGNGDRGRELLDYGADPNACDDKGTTALMYAAANGHEAFVRLLLERGARLDIRSRKGSTALDYACRFHHREMEVFLRAHMDTVRA